MKIITVSTIANTGEQYICGLLGEEKFNHNGLWHDCKAFSIDLNHRKQTSSICTFNWINGAVTGYKTVKTYNEIIDVSEIEKVLIQCNLI